MSLAEALRVDLTSLAERTLAPVEVVILDTGIDATHPDLRGRVSESFEIAIEVDGPRALASPYPAQNDSFGHGTAVAGVIAAIAPNARLVDVRIVGNGDVEMGELLLAGLRFCLLRRFRLLNLGLACHERLQEPLAKLCEIAYWQDQVVVAATRNQPLLEHGLPARLSSCIGVESDCFSSPFAFRFRAGNPIECIARGEEVAVAAPGGRYTVSSGTSLAASAVTGLCALLLGAFPGLSPYEMKSALKALAGL